MPLHDLKKNNDTLRKTIRTKRATLSQQSQQQKSDKIVHQVYHSSPFIKAKKIAFYHAVQGEADPKKLAELCDKDGSNKQFYLPILSQKKEQSLIFAPINKKSQYKNNKFSIPEPIYKKEDLITGDKLDLVIVPLVCFDKQGSRLGMGGGFYDRTFSFKKQLTEKTILMGFAYDFQKVTALQTELWDIAMDYIATESTIVRYLESKN